MQFMNAAAVVVELADDAADVGDADVTLCVHAGIAASDAICAYHLQRYHSGESHQEAVALLSRVRPNGAALAADLGHLLGLKTKAGYTHRAVTPQDRRSAERRARALVEAAHDLPL